MTAQKVTMRLMRKKDVPVVCKMIRSLGAHFGDDAKGKPRDLLTYCFGSKKLSTVILAYVAGKPAGFAITRDWVNLTQGFRVRHVDFLFVEEEFRGSGVATALIKDIQKRTVQEGCGLLDISASITNKAANNLYKKYGFKKRTMRMVPYRMRLKA